MNGTVFWEEVTLYSSEFPGTEKQGVPGGEVNGDSASEAEEEGLYSRGALRTGFISFSYQIGGAERFNTARQISRV